MALAPGSRVGPYEVTALLGQGGMGEVYRARDTKLNRDVAIKVLPDLFAADPQRLARSEVQPCSRKRRILHGARHVCRQERNIDGRRNRMRYQLPH
jgi:serine/threonine protein kinase